MSAPSPARRRLLGTTAAALTIGALGVATAATASAHVTVNSTDARQGGFGKVTVRVPNESATAGTVKLVVSLPADSPLASVSIKPHPGWTASAPKVKLPAPVKQGDLTLTEAVRTITWTADRGVSIKPGQFDEFDFSAGRLPTDKTQLSFPAVQTYSDGTVVKWDEAQQPGGAEPDHPAPVLNLLPAKAAVNAAPASDPTAGAAQPGAAGSSSDGVARGLGIAGLVLGAAGLVTGLVRRGRVAERQPE